MRMRVVPQHADVLRSNQRVDAAHLRPVVAALQHQRLGQRLLLLEDDELVLGGGGGVQPGEVGHVLLLPLLVGHLVASGTVSREVLLGVLFVEVALTQQDGFGVLEGRLDRGRGWVDEGFLPWTPPLPSDATAARVKLYLLVWAVQLLRFPPEYSRPSPLQQQFLKVNRRIALSIHPLLVPTPHHRPVNPNHPLLDIQRLMVPLRDLHLALLCLVGRRLLPTAVLGWAVHEFLLGLVAVGLLFSQLVVEGLGEVDAVTGTGQPTFLYSQPHWRVIKDKQHLRIDTSQSQLSTTILHTYKQSVDSPHLKRPLTVPDRQQFLADDVDAGYPLSLALSHLPPLHLAGVQQVQQIDIRKQVLIGVESAN